MQGRSEGEGAPPRAVEEPRADTAVSPVIRGEPVSIPASEWGTALAADDTETVVAELVEDDGPVVATDRDDASVDGETRATRAGRRRSRRPVLGWTSVLLGIATAVLHAIAVNEATARAADAATVLAWSAIIVSAVGILVGIAAMIARSGRLVGLVGALLSLFANPWVLLQLLLFFAP